MKNEKTEFNVQQVKLSESNLIEASAGTGKTYSIAILVLRLILFKDIPIGKILMVTFTNAAVAELELRIRKFVREASRWAESDRNSREGFDKTILEIVDLAIKEKGIDQVRILLSDARIFLDEISVFTIHSFCQRTLMEFAFETGQLFNCELAADDGSLLESAVNEYWRSHITTISPIVLKELIKSGKISRGILSVLVSKVISGKKFIDEYIPEDIEEVLESLYRKLEEKKNKCMSYIEENIVEITEKVNTNSYTKKWFGSALRDPEVFFNVFLTKINEKTTIKVLPELIAVFYEYQKVGEEILEHVNNETIRIYHDAIEKMEEYIRTRKAERNNLSFDDLIQNLYEAIRNDKSKSIRKVVLEKYTAVFIDESQDTDQVQLDIFEDLFGNSKTIVFYIGDPKQSIYRFRGADLDSYKKAARNVAHQFTMKVNFRSTPPLIDAMNRFFCIEADFFKDSQILYEEVKNGADHGALLYNNEQVVPFELLIGDNNKDSLVSSVCNEINNLLCENYYIGKNGAQERVKPSDIAVLVRSKADASGIRNELGKLGIPSVTIDESSVMKSYEALDIMFIIHAMISPSNGNINRALINNFTGLTKENLLEGDRDVHLDRFRNYKELLGHSGVYNALMRFYEDYRVRQVAFQQSEGQRIIANFLQVAELLHKKYVKDYSSPEQLVDWMKRIFDGEETNGDEYVQRIESDENAVHIVTVHKSKGLAYNIVFAPNLNMNYEYDSNARKRNHGLIEFKRDEKSCISCIESAENLDDYRSETLQEARRQAYVAITRAVYKCYVGMVADTKGKCKSGSLNQILDQFPLDELLFRKRIGVPRIGVFKQDSSQKKRKARSFTGEIDNSWKVMSYSGIAEKHDRVDYGISEMGKELYDQFVFRDMPKGKDLGLFLHEVMENISFSDRATWGPVLETVGRKYPETIYNGDLQEKYLALIEAVMTASVPLGNTPFSLENISQKEKLPELSFYYGFRDFMPEWIAEDEDVIPGSGASYSGMMYGIIDLFFRYNGKYYILDWKSNHIGNNVSEYGKDNLHKAMIANSYNLQSYIYTVVAVRFLKQNLKDFDYARDFGGSIYVFLRGARTGEVFGIYTSKEDQTKIEKML